MKELWQNERSKAGITLGLWLVFIFFIFMLASCNSSSRKGVATPEPKSNEEDILYRVSSLLSSDYSFKMTIELNDLSSKRVYDANKYIDEKTNSDMFSGYIEETSGINKFRCGDLKTNEYNTISPTCYKIFLDHEEEELLYKEDVMQNINYVQQNAKRLEKKENHTYLYTKDDKTLKVIDDDNNKIVRIIIETTDEKITIDFNYNYNEKNA